MSPNIPQQPRIILEATWGHKISFLVICWFHLKLVQHAQDIPAGKSTKAHQHVDGPENDLISKPTALLVHILWRFGDGGLVLACCFLLRMMSQPGAQELLKGFSYLFLNTSCWQHFTLVPNALTFEMHPILPRI